MIKKKIKKMKQYKKEKLINKTQNFNKFKN